MKKLFLWFYCLPIWQAVLWALIAAGVFLWLRMRFGHTKLWRAGVWTAFCGWMAVILVATLARGTSVQEPVLMPFASYRTVLSGGQRELLRANFMNVLLFFPLGLLGMELLPRQWGSGWKVLLTVLAFLILSMGIEWCQYRFGLGLAETDDVIHNTVGALLGAMIWLLPQRIADHH